MRDFRVAAAFLCFVAWLPMAAYGQGTTAAQPKASAASTAAGQVTSPPATAAMPSDPAQLLALAAKLDGLTGQDVKPWHLKASYETFDEKGKSTGTGTYEEWWVSDKQYKRSYTSASFTQTEYATEKGIYRSGEQTWPKVPLSLLRPSLLAPLPSPDDLVGATFAVEKHALGGMNLQCLRFTWPIPGHTALGGTSPIFCLSRSAPILRVVAEGGTRQIFANNISLFQGHYLPRDLEFSQDRKAQLKVHIESLATLPSQEALNLRPSPEAVLLSVPVSLPTKEEVPTTCLWKVTPMYPEEAKYKRIQGNVVFNAHIGKDGKLRDLSAAASPSPILTKAAENAVRQWRYTPMRMAGEPVDVLTQINVVFSLGG
jgi:TonB family protein